MFKLRKAAAAIFLTMMLTPLATSCATYSTRPDQGITVPADARDPMDPNSGRETTLRPFVDPPGNLDPELRAYLYRKYRFTGDAVAGVSLTDELSLAYVSKSLAGSIPEVLVLEEKKKTLAEKQMQDLKVQRLLMLPAFLVPNSPALGTAAVVGSTVMAQNQEFMEGPRPSDYARVREGFNRWLEKRLGDKDAR